MLLQRRGNLVFQLLVSCFQRAFQVNGDDVFPVCRECIGDVLQGDESAGVHQVFAEQQRGCSRLAPDRHLRLVLPGARVVFDLGALDGLDHAKLGSKALFTR